MRGERLFYIGFVIGVVLAALAARGDVLAL
jgi:hypothetical protein